MERRRTSSRFCSPIRRAEAVRVALTAGTLVPMQSCPEVWIGVSGLPLAGEGGVRRARGRTAATRPLRSRRRRASGRLLGLKSRSGARLLARRGSATSKQPSRCRSAAERQCRRWNRETAGPAQRQQCEPTGRALLIGPFSTVSRETLASVAERNCYAGGSVSHGLIGSPPYRYRRPALLIATSGAVLCCSAIPLRHRRVCASPAITDLSRIALSGDRLWRLRSIRRRVKRASKDSGLLLEGLR